VLGHSLLDVEKNGADFLASVVLENRVYKEMQAGRLSRAGGTTGRSVTGRRNTRGRRKGLPSDDCLGPSSVAHEQVNLSARFIKMWKTTCLDAAGEGFCESTLESQLRVLLSSPSEFD
jgi:hypothetical protein